MSLLQLITDQNSPDNNVRRSAELEYARQASQDPSNVAYFLMDQASNDAASVDIRQGCLLHLKQLVPKYWSIGFSSFVGPPINQELKQAIRTNLLELTASTQSKVRAGAAYVIVQIAAADYPDEWPDLMNVLYTMSLDSDERRIVGALTVFSDLFDDLITEEQFWGGVGASISNHLLQLITSNVAYATKAMAVKLYETVSQNFSSQEAFDTPERRQFVHEHVNSAFPVLLGVLQFDAADADQFTFKANVYKVLHSFVSAFDKRIDMGLKQQLVGTALPDFEATTSKYANWQGDSAGLLREILDTINATNHSVGLNGEFLQPLLVSAQIPQESRESYSDINEYVTDITGLNVDGQLRETVFDLVSEINEVDAIKIFQFAQSLDSRDLEAQLFLLESALQNEAEFSADPLDLLSRCSQLISYNSDPLVIGRCFLMLPHLFEKFELSAEIAVKALVNMVEFASAYEGEGKEIVKFATLVSVTLYKNLLEFENVFSQTPHVQDKLFKLVYALLDDSEEDSLAALLDAVTAAIIISPSQASKIEVNPGVNVIDLIFKISFKEAANIQLTTSATECLQSLLAGISLEDYIAACERSLPFIYNIINVALKGRSVEYSPELYLSLELLSIIINSVQELPDSIFQYTFPVIKTLILSTSDNQILQSGGEVFNNMLKRASTSFVNYTDPNGELGMNSLLEIVSKFLSPELSDSAAMNTGLIILSLTKQFQAYLGFDFLSQILAATANRLVIAKETITIENLILVFCNLVLTSPEEMINFLSNSIEVAMPNSQKLNALDAILPIWFTSFEVTRGYDKIKENSLALGKIFILGDSRVENLTVNGDIIPYDTDKIITRSMSKAMPDKYTQIPASLKILKLLIGELSFQNQQPNAEEYLPAEQGGDDEGWEDLDSVGVPNFEKLQSFVDDDEPEKPADDSLNQLLQTFFKECIAKNLGNFQRYYEMLSDDEKKVVTEYVAF